MCGGHRGLMFDPLKMRKLGKGKWRVARRRGRVFLMPSTPHIYINLNRLVEEKNKTLTIVVVQTPLSTSHFLTVESNPQLTASPPSPPSFPSPANTTLLTRAVCPFKTFTGPFLLTSPSVPILRRFFDRSRMAVSEVGTSSEVGIFVSQSPIRVSHDEVRRWLPLAFDVILDKGAVWRCKLAIVFDLFFIRENSVRRAERSCDDVAINRVSSGKDGAGITENDEIGAGWRKTVDAGAEV